MLEGCTLLSTNGMPPRQLKNRVGERVRAARLTHQPPFDQADLAEALASLLGTTIGQATVSRLETGDRPVTDIELVALAEILGVEAGWLLYGDP